MNHWNLLEFVYNTFNLKILKRKIWSCFKSFESIPFDNIIDQKFNPKEIRITLERNHHFTYSCKYFLKKGIGNSVLINPESRWAYGIPHKLCDITKTVKIYFFYHLPVVLEVIQYKQVQLLNKKRFDRRNRSKNCVFLNVYPLYRFLIWSWFDESINQWEGSIGNLT